MFRGGHNTPCLAAQGAADGKEIPPAPAPDPRPPTPDPRGRPPTPDPRILKIPYSHPSYLKKCYQKKYLGSRKHFFR